MKTHYRGWHKDGPVRHVLWVDGEPATSITGHRRVLPDRRGPWAPRGVPTGHEVCGRIQVRHPGPRARANAPGSSD